MTGTAHLIMNNMFVHFHKLSLAILLTVSYSIVQGASAAGPSRAGSAGLCEALPWMMDDLEIISQEVQSQHQCQSFPQDLIKNNLPGIHRLSRMRMDNCLMEKSVADMYIPFMEQLPKQNPDRDRKKKEVLHMMVHASENNCVNTEPQYRMTKRVLNVLAKRKEEVQNANKHEICSAAKGLRELKRLCPEKNIEEKEED